VGARGETVNPSRFQFSGARSRSPTTAWSIPMILFSAAALARDGMRMHDKQIGLRPARQPVARDSRARALVMETVTGAVENGARMWFRLCRAPAASSVEIDRNHGYTAAAQHDFRLDLI